MSDQRTDLGTERTAEPEPGVPAGPGLDAVFDPDASEATDFVRQVEGDEAGHASS